MKKIEHMKRYMKRSFLLLPALLLACALTASAEVLPGANYGKIAVGANKVEMNGSYIGATGAELYIPVTANNNTTGHGLLAIAGTATGSTKIVLNSLLASWDGTQIDLVEALNAGSTAGAFTMDATTATTSGKKAVLRSRVNGEKRTWYLTTGAELDLKVYLQGPMVTGGRMTNEIQIGDTDGAFETGPKLPVTDPYGLSTAYSGINTNLVTLPVTDWILVEIWKLNLGTEVKTVLEKKALLLKPNGQVVDVEGNKPLFAPQTGAVRIVVKHRNHLAVIGNEITSFSGSVPYDFSTGLNKAFKYDTEDPNPMVLKNGYWTLWAGDINDDGTIDSRDRNIFNPDFKNNLSDGYIRTDLNMDGVVDSKDRNIFNSNFKSGLSSPVANF